MYSLLSNDFLREMKPIRRCMSRRFQRQATPLNLSFNLPSLSRIILILSEGKLTWNVYQVVGYRLTRLDNPVFIALPKPIKTELSIHFTIDWKIVDSLRTVKCASLPERNSGGVPSSSLGDLILLLLLPSCLERSRLLLLNLFCWFPGMVTCELFRRCYFRIFQFAEW